MDVYYAGAWQVDSTFGLNQYGLPLYALVVVSADYKPFSAPGLLMFCSSDPGTTHEIEAIETLIRVALQLVRLKPGRCRACPVELLLLFVDNTKHPGELPTALNLSESRPSTPLDSYPAAIHIDKGERERKGILLALEKENASSVRVLLCHFHVLAAWEEHLFVKFDDSGPRGELRACLKVALNAKVNFYTNVLR